MKPLICPQCGGSITDYSEFERFAVCNYCETKFLIEPQKAAAIVHSPPSSGSNFNVYAIAVGAACVIIGGIFVLALLAGKENPQPDAPRTLSTPYPTPPVRLAPAPTATPNQNLLEFGGKGTGDGLFQDADALAVDAKGRIYVADETLRVQQFNEKGEFLKLWQIPSETQYYRRARTIEKIAVDDSDRLYVLVAGLVLIYEQDSSRPLKLVHFSPNPVQDFAFRSDGSRLYLINGGDMEYFVHVTETGKTVRRVNNFHTKAADAAVSPRETALAAIRFAVDGAGNIFSIYAFGDLGSYQLSYNSDELMIFRFTPEGRYVDKFVETMNSCGIAVDNQSRVYISDNDSIEVFSPTGEHAATVPDLRFTDAFALDRENNIYVLRDDRVVKRAAIQ